jgi:hypothetical protein
MILCHSIAYADTLQERVARLETAMTAHDRLDVERDKALQLQYAINLNHFEALNGEQTRIAKIQEQYMPRSEYVIEHKYHNDRITELENYKNNQIGYMAAISAFVSLVILLISKHFWSNDK